MNKMNKVSKIVSTIALVSAFTFGLIAFNNAQAATAPSLGATATYAVLGSTYTNTTAGTTISGDVGYTTGPAVAPLGTHTNYGSGAPYSTAGTDQGVTLSALASQVCDFTFGSATDLSLLPQPLTAGVYCVTGAQSIGTGGITLGSGIYVFRSTGALNTVANSNVTGGNACNVFWTPTATTLGANSTFLGTDIDASGITIGSTVAWTGRALAFGGTVTTDSDTITVPSCGAVPPPISSTTATLHVIKNVINNNGGTAVASSFNIHVKLSGANVSGSPALGIAAPGTPYTLSAGTYVVSEDANALYSATFSGACDLDGSVTLVANDDKTCTITNDDIAPVVISPASLNVVKVVVNDNGRTKTVADFPLFVNGTLVTSGVTNIFPAGTYTVAETGDANYTRTFSGDCNANGQITLVAGDSKTCVMTNNDIAPIVPSLPKTGFPPQEKSAPWNIIISAGVLIALSSFFIARKKLSI